MKSYGVITIIINDYIYLLIFLVTIIKLVNSKITKFELIVLYYTHHTIQCSFLLIISVALIK